MTYLNTITNPRVIHALKQMAEEATRLGIKVGAALVSVHLELGSSSPGKITSSVMSLTFDEGWDGHDSGHENYLGTAQKMCALGVRRIVTNDTTLKPIEGESNDPGMIAIAMTDTEGFPGGVVIAVSCANTEKSMAIAEIGRTALHL